MRTCKNCKTQKQIKYKKKKQDKTKQNKKNKKNQKMPATDEITSYHENQITPKQTILATDFQWIFKEQFSFKFQDNWRFNILKCESYKPQNW